MKNTPNSWIEWWNTETVYKPITWQKNMEIFIRATEPLLKYSAEDVILDIGCGPGYLADFLKDKVKELHCADTAERYLNICRDKFKEDKHVFFYKLDEKDYTNLSFFKAKKFSIIICLSVIQYYKNIDEVEKLIEEVHHITLSGAKFLIADIPITNSKTLDIYTVLNSSIKEKRLLEMINLLFQLRISDYYKVHSSLGLLVFSIQKLEKLISKHNLDAQLVKIKMTSSENRVHLLIKSP